MAEFHTPVEKPKPWKEFRARCKSRMSVPFYYTEWLCARGAYALSRWSFLQLLEYAGGLSILVAAIWWLAETGDRTQQRHFQAWMVINTAQGKTGNGGRIEALQELNDDEVKLVGVDVSQAYLQGIRLDHANLRRADLHEADMRNASLRYAHLEQVNFHSANLQGADLSNADLTNADLSGSDLTDANLTGATLKGAIVGGADLGKTDLGSLLARGAVTH